VTASRALRRSVAILLALGALTHFVGLSSPRQIVFDEVTFGKFVQAYCCTGERFFDIHPPHGKLVIGLAAWLGGFSSTYSFDTIGQSYGREPVFALRFVPALMGTLLPLIFFWLMRELKASPPIALLGGVLVALDNGLLVETRLLLIDGMLLAATFSAIACFLTAQRHGAKWPWLLATGALAGLAMGTKLTGLVAPGLIGLCLVFGLGIVSAPWGSRIRQMLIIYPTAAAVYVSGWVVHWFLLPNPGPGDAFYPTTGKLVTDLITAQRTMLSANMSLTATHPDASAPWTWPLMKVAPYYWQGDGASIYMIGNPILWWGASIVFFGLLIQLFVLRPLGTKLQPPVRTAPRIWLPLAGWALAYGPLLKVTRVLFLYHYLMPLLFSLAFVLLWLDRSGWLEPGAPRHRQAYIAIIALAAVAFLLISPLSYGFSAGGYDEWLANFIRSWR
jgi:dolichyl-phosphate-mannose--protein O-mannosyl transferase